MGATTPPPSRAFPRAPSSARCTARLRNGRATAPKVESGRRVAHHRMSVVRHPTRTQHGPPGKSVRHCKIIAGPACGIQSETAIGSEHDQDASHATTGMARQIACTPAAMIYTQRNLPQSAASLTTWCCALRHAVPPGRHDRSAALAGRSSHRQPCIARAEATARALALHPAAPKASKRFVLDAGPVAPRTS
jgi:hypothetical protein